MSKSTSSSSDSSTDNGSQTIVVINGVGNGLRELFDDMFDEGRNIIYDFADFEFPDDFNDLFDSDEENENSGNNYGNSGNSENSGNSYDLDDSFEYCDEIVLTHPIEENTSEKAEKAEERSFSNRTAEMIEYVNDDDYCVIVDIINTINV